MIKELMDKFESIKEDIKKYLISDNSYGREPIELIKILLEHSWPNNQCGKIHQIDCSDLNTKLFIIEGAKSDTYYLTTLNDMDDINDVLDVLMPSVEDYLLLMYKIVNRTQVVGFVVNGYY